MYSKGEKLKSCATANCIEKTINNTIKNLLNNFHYLFCTDNSSDCPNAGINKLDSYDKYYFQVSKLRDALNHIILLETSIKEIIDDNILKDLSVNNFFIHAIIDYCSAIADGIADHWCYLKVFLHFHECSACCVGKIRSFISYP